MLLVLCTFIEARITPAPAGRQKISYLNSVLGLGPESK